MPKSTFVACAKTDCKWNQDGQCDKSEIFVDDGVMCSNYEPEMIAPPMGMGMGPDPRSALIQQMIGGGGPPIGGGPPPIPVGAGPSPPPGEAPVTPTGAPPPLRF